MSAASALAWRMTYGSNHGGGSGAGAIGDIRRGEAAIFGDGPYPHKLTEFVGQQSAKDQLMVAMLSAAKRQAALPHILLASGIAGIGKTSLGKIIASSLNVGYAEVGGTVTVRDIKPTLQAMQERDVLFIDEIHRMVAGGKRNAEWLLQLLQDGTLVLPTGVVTLPPITVIAATTDAQKLPATILDRFPIQPILEPYTPEEAVQIARVTAKRLDVLLEPAQFHRVAAAADYNPRRIGTLLMTVRDIKLATPEHPDPVAQAVAWAQLTTDGLSRGEQDYLMLLLGYGGLASQNTMKAALSETEITLTEGRLIKRGYVMVTPKGRELTKLGAERARELLEDHHDQE